jgi:hypothetical protein
MNTPNSSLANYSGSCGIADCVTCLTAKFQAKFDDLEIKFAQRDAERQAKSDTELAQRDAE